MLALAVERPEPSSSPNFVVYSLGVHRRYRNRRCAVHGAWQNQSEYPEDFETLQPAAGGDNRRQQATAELGGFGGSGGFCAQSRDREMRRLGIRPDHNGLKAPKNRRKFAFNVTKEEKRSVEQRRRCFRRLQEVVDVGTVVLLSALPSFHRRSTCKSRHTSSLAVTATQFVFVARQSRVAASRACRRPFVSQTSDCHKLVSQTAANAVAIQRIAQMKVLWPQTSKPLGSVIARVR